MLLLPVAAAAKYGVARIIAVEAGNAGGNSEVVSEDAATAAKEERPGGVVEVLTRRLDALLAAV